MTAPTPTLFVQGQGEVSADNLNTNVQATSSQAQMRALVGTVGMNLFLQGTVSLGDNGAGFYYWNPTGTQPDNNFDYITPYSAGSGQWERYDIGGSDISVGEFGSNSNPITIVNTAATTFNFTGAVSVTSEFGEGGPITTIDILSSPDLEMVDGSVTLSAITEQFAGTNITFTSGESGEGTINSYYPIIYGGDLEYITGDPPIPVQETLVNAFTSEITISLPGTVTPGNLLLLAVCGGPAGYVSTPSGYSLVASEYPASGFYGGLAIFALNVTATNQNTVVVTGNSSAGGSGTYAFFREWTGVFSYSASSAGYSNNSVQNWVTPSYGSTNGYASAYYGLIATAVGASYTGSSPPNFTSPAPLSASIQNTGYANPNFEGAPAVGCEVILPNADGAQQISVWSSVPYSHVAAIIQLVGNPTINLTPTLAVYQSLVVDGYIIPPTINTAGMIEFEGPDTLAAYLDVASNGTLLSSTITELNFTGNTDPLSLSGTTLNIPSQSFIEGTITATGIATLMGDISLIGTANPTIYAPPLVAGNNITITGSNTISGAATIAANTAFENNGTYLGLAGTINAGANLTASSSGGIITFSAPAVAGALTLLSSQTISGASQVVFPPTGTLSPGFGYMVIGSQVSPSVGSVDPCVQFGTGSSVGWITGADYYNGLMSPAGGNYTSSNNNEIIIGFASGIGNNSFRLTMLGDASYNDPHWIEGTFLSSWSWFQGGLTPSAQTPISAFKIYFLSGNISGIFDFYSIAR